MSRQDKHELFIEKVLCYDKFRRNSKKELVKISCYIEEYSNQNGKLCARLRDKASNKKVVLTGHNTDKNHLLRFFAQAKIHQDIMPTIYDKDGKDIVAVRGYIVSDAPEEIVVNIDIEMGGYLFE